MADVDKSKSTRVRIAGGACGGFTLSSFSSLFLSFRSSRIDGNSGTVVRRAHSIISANYISREGRSRKLLKATPFVQRIR